MPYLDAPGVPLEDGDVGHIGAIWRQPPHAAALVARHRRHRRSVVARPRKVVDRVLEGGEGHSHVKSALTTVTTEGKELIGKEVPLVRDLHGYESKSAAYGVVVNENSGKVFFYHLSRSLETTISRVTLRENPVIG